MARVKSQVPYKGRPTRITPVFSTETLKSRRVWTDGNRGGMGEGLGGQKGGETVVKM